MSRRQICQLRATFERVGISSDNRVSRPSFSSAERCRATKEDCRIASKETDDDDLPSIFMAQRRILWIPIMWPTQFAEGEDSRFMSDAGIGP
jgi:hypothetical protein